MPAWLPVWLPVMKLSLIVLFAARVPWVNDVLRRWRDGEESINASLDDGGAGVVIPHDSAGIDAAVVALDDTVAAARALLEASPLLHDLRTATFFAQKAEVSDDFDAEFNAGAVSAQSAVTQPGAALNNLGVFDDLTWPQWILLQGAAVALVWAFLRWERESNFYNKFAHVFVREPLDTLVGSSRLTTETLMAVTIVTAIASTGALFQTSQACTLGASCLLAVAIMIFFYFADGPFPPLARHATPMQLVAINVMTASVDGVRFACNPPHMWRYGRLWRAAVFLPVLLVVLLCTAVELPRRFSNRRALPLQAAATVACAWAAAWLLQLMNSRPAVAASVTVGLIPFIAYGCWADRLTHQAERQLDRARQLRCVARLAFASAAAADADDDAAGTAVFVRNPRV
jgi:hypothetical protein